MCVFVSLHLILCLLCQRLTQPLSVILSLCLPALFLAPFLSHILTLCASSSSCVLYSRLDLCYSLHPSSKAPYGIYLHILDGIWMLYTVNTTSRNLQSIQALYQFTNLTKLHFKLIWWHFITKCWRVNPMLRSFFMYCVLAATGNMMSWV